MLVSVGLCAEGLEVGGYITVVAIIDGLVFGAERREFWYSAIVSRSSCNFPDLFEFRPRISGTILYFLFIPILQKPFLRPI